MIDFDDVKRYLPQYLSDADRRALFSELDRFPNNIDKRFYTTSLDSERSLLQGDGVDLLRIADVEHSRFAEAPCFIISNSCDNDSMNKHIYGASRLIYAPIIKIRKYRAMLIDNMVRAGFETEAQIDAHLSDIKRQHVTQAFFLPSGMGLTEDSLVFLDMLSYCKSSAILPDDVIKKRMFSLSNYGFYLLLVKLAIHFTRIQERIPRGGLPA